MLRVVFIALILFCLNKATYAMDNDNLIVPGERVGLVNKNSTEAELLRVLPRKQVERTVYYEGEGGYRCASKLFPNTNKEMIIVWQSDTEEIAELSNSKTDKQITQENCIKKPSFRNPEFIMLQGKTLWKTKENITVGMDLATIENITKSPVSFNICGCDIDGNIYQGLLNKMSGHLDDQNNPNISDIYYNSDSDKKNKDIISSDKLSKEQKHKIFLDKIYVVFSEK